MTSARSAAVMGSPIAHSLSPALHLAAYRSLGLTAWTYDVIEVDAAGLPDAIDELDGSGRQWVGLSLTMPLKQAVLPLLDGISALALAVGAVNTVTFEDGARFGDNTDVAGIVAALREAGGSDPAVDGAGEHRDDGAALVLGGGATAASALAALAQLGITQPRVAVRSIARAEPMLAAADRLGVRPELIDWSEAGEAAGSAPLVISTVPAGVADGLLPEGSAVTGTLLDVVYWPWPTVLARSWVAAGGVAIAGFEMLLHQAVAQVARWTGEMPDVSAMRTAAEQVLLSRG